MPGTATLSILDEQENKALDTCATCPSLCRWSCPVAEAEARETTSPHRLVVLSGLLKQERLRPEQADGVPFHCSHCMACTQACLHDNDVPLLMSLARSRLLAGQVGPDAVRQVSGQFAVAGNSAGRSLESALIAAAEAAGQAVVPHAEDVYWPGCEVLSTAPESAGDALRAIALSGARQPEVVPGSANCCGLPLFWAGELDGFRAHASRFAAQFADVDRIVAHDPTCAHALTVRYRQLGISFRPAVTTLVEYLADAWPATPAPAAPPTTLAYMDACTLARSSGRPNAARELIRKAAGAAPSELAGPTAERADCCGGQGLLPELVPATAAAMAAARIDAFRASGAERLMTASPRCHRHLKTIDPSLPLDDLVGWLAGQ